MFILMGESWRRMARTQKTIPNKKDIARIDRKIIAITQIVLSFNT